MLIDRLEQLDGRRLLLGMTLCFAAVHAVYFAVGVRFDPKPLDTYWQYLDAALLKDRLLESLWYLHSQPPLYNLFLGVLVKLAGGLVSPLLHALHLAMGLALYLGLFLLMVELQISRPVALAVSTAFMLSPSFVLYEHLQYQVLPLASLLTWSVLFLARLVRRGDRVSAAGFPLTIFGLCGIWALYHLAYFWLAIGLALSLRRDLARRLLLWALLPGLLLTGLYFKNFLLFGQFTSSTWVGMNLWGTTGSLLPPAVVERLVSDHKVSPVARTLRFSYLAAYPAEFRIVPVRFSGIPVLDQPRKQNGHVNLNHIGYIRLSEQYLADSLSVIRHMPAAYATGVKLGWYIYFASSAQYYLLPNQDVLDGWIQLWDRYIYGAGPVFAVQLPVSWTLLLGLPALVLYAAARSLARRDGAQQRAVLQYLVLNILYVAFVGNLMEAWENNRFRFVTDPLYAVLFGLWVQGAVIPWLRGWRARGSSRSEL